jgi:predicted RecA/RadA family phage recombinase
MHDGTSWKSFLGTITFTAGSVLFAGSDGAAAQDNANLFWDDTNNRLGIGTASPANKLHVVGDAQITTDLTVGDQLIVSGIGPHAIGGAVDTTRQLLLTGSFTGASNAIGLGVESTLIPTANSVAFGALFSSTLNKAGSGTHADFAGIQIQPPTIGAGAAALTNASTLKITGAPTGATNNRALWVAAGLSELAGGLKLLQPNGGEGLLITSSSQSDLFFIKSINAGTDDSIKFGTNIAADLRFFTAAAERIRLTADGIFALGTTVTTGAAAGEVVLANGKSLRGINVAGSTTLSLIQADAGDRIFVAPGGQDIRWGTALVALGGGAAPTFGTIGGSGPATAAQNTWMRVVDSGGAAFWVPVWK